MGMTPKVRAIETIKDTKRRVETSKDESKKTQLINLRNSLITLRRDKDINVEDVIDSMLELIGILLK